MYAIVVIVARTIAAIVMKLVKSFKAANAAARANALCNSCANVYSVKGYGGKQLIFCNYTSELRAISFAVCECSGYRNKNIAPPARVIGFVRLDEVGTGEAFPAVAIRIERD